MSGIQNSTKAMLENLSAYVSLARTFLRRKSPVKTMIREITATFHNMMNIKKRLLIAKYRVNHLRYRLNQMETLINDNNPTTKGSGKNFNQLR